MKANERDHNASIAAAEMRMALHEIAEKRGLTDWEFVRAVNSAASEATAAVAKLRLREERS